jgi:hypothetical protein
MKQPGQRRPFLTPHSPNGCCVNCGSNPLFVNPSYLFVSWIWMSQGACGWTLALDKPEGFRCNISAWVMSSPEGLSTTTISTPSAISSRNYPRVTWPLDRVVQSAVVRLGRDCS